jgi:hypothetical protein
MEIKFNNVKNKEWYTSLWRLKILGYFLFLLLPIFLAIDLFLIINNYLLFKVANIDSLKRSDYIKIWSRFKVKTSFIRKLGCVYCSYVNGLAYFYRDIAMSYEMLFCPFKQKEITKIEHHNVFKDW